MKRQSTLSNLFRILIAGTLLVSAHAGQTEGLPPAEDLLDGHIEATGGKSAHLELHWRKKTGKLAVDLAGHEFEAKIEEQYLAPDKSHVLIDGSFFSQVAVCDGKQAWEWRPGHSDGSRTATVDAGVTVLLEGAQRARSIEKARFHGAVHWREKFASVKTLGVVEVDGQPAYEVQVETKAGEQYSQFYDKASGRLVKRIRTVPSHGEEVDMEVFLSEYREFDGIWIATRVHAELRSPSFGEGTQTWTYTKIEHKKEIPASLFEMPAELRKGTEEHAE